MASATGRSSRPLVSGPSTFGEGTAPADWTGAVSGPAGLPFTDDMSHSICFREAMEQTRCRRVDTVRWLLLDDGDLFRRVDLDLRHAIDFFHRAGDSDRLALEMFG